MKFSTLAAIFAALVGANAGFLEPIIVGVPSNATIISNALATLKNVSDSTMSKCLKCKSRLAIGKEIAKTSPELIPDIFTQLCVAEKLSTTCASDYGRNTVEHSYTGTDFANMLSLMDPLSLDGEYFCYYKQGAACPLPETPEYDLSSWWPEKKDEYKVSPEPSGKTFNVLHISDFHLEYMYDIGAEANCSQGMCCTPHNYNNLNVPEGYNFTDIYDDAEIANLSFYDSIYDSQNNFIQGDLVDIVANGNSSIWEPANTFGAYYCDPPEIMINSSLKSMMEYQKANNLNFEFSIFTGDLVDHDEVEFISHETTVEVEERVFRDIKHFLGGIPVFPVLGNHDTFPYGALAQESSGFTNLYDWNSELMADLWEDYNWIGEKEAAFATKHYTGYSVSIQRGLKVIALNSNCWYQKNFYAFWDITNPDSFGQFQFLVDELIESEKAGQRVWIIAHIPTANGDTLAISSSVFAKVVERFSPYTIAGIFFGHTHLDQFQILYAGNGTESTKTVENVINFGWISQSITPNNQKNPAWRYYEVDEDTFSIMNSFNYYTPLNESFTNGGAEPEWKYEYSARDAYDPEGTFPETYPLNATFWHYVQEKMNNETAYNQLYTDYQYRLSPYVPDCVNTDGCEDNHCYVTSFTVDQYLLCQALEETSN